jgi:hypothetical protein
MNQIEDKLQSLSIHNENTFIKYKQVLNELLSTKLITLKKCSKCPRLFDVNNFFKHKDNEEYREKTFSKLIYQINLQME